MKLFHKFRMKHLLEALAGFNEEQWDKGQSFLLTWGMIFICLTVTVVHVLKVYAIDDTTQAVKKALDIYAKKQVTKPVKVAQAPTDQQSNATNSANTSNQPQANQPVPEPPLPAPTPTPTPTPAAEPVYNQPPENNMPSPSPGGEGYNNFNNYNSSASNPAPSGPGKANIIFKDENKTKSSEEETPPVDNTKPIMIDLLELKNMDIIDVLKLISQKSGLNIVAGRDVSGRVNLYLKDVEVRDALRIIAESNNLGFAEEDGVIKVMTQRDFQMKYGVNFGEKLQTKTIQLVNVDTLEIATVLNQMKSIMGRVIPEKNSNSIVIIDLPDKIKELTGFLKRVDTPRKTEVFTLNHATAEEVAKKLPDVLTKNVGKVEVDVRLNKLLITDLAEKMPLIEKFIEAVDGKQKEVLIEAKIVQVVLSDEYKLGVDWEAIVRNYHSLDLKSSFSVLDPSDKRGKVSIGTLDSDAYTALVEALKTIGTTNLLSSPRITVVNNKEAKILVGSTEPYITSTTITPSAGPTTTSESVNFIEVGVKLYVTPTIHNDGFITMQIKPEVSSVTSTVKTSNNNTIPVVETSQAETTVIIRDGSTIVIGGLIKDEKIKSTRKIPGLGDIPLLGSVFRSQDDTKTKTELVIFLTPRLITGDHNEDNPSMEDESSDKVSMTDKHDALSDFVYTKDYLDAGERQARPEDFTPSRSN